MVNLDRRRTIKLFGLAFAALVAFVALLAVLRDDGEKPLVTNAEQQVIDGCTAELMHLFEMARQSTDPPDLLRRNLGLRTERGDWASSRWFQLGFEMDYLGENAAMYALFLDVTEFCESEVLASN